MSSTNQFDLLAEQYLLGELPEEKIKALNLNKKFLEKVSALQKENMDFFQKINVKELSEKTKLKAESKIIKFPVKTIAAITTLAACFIAIINFSPVLYNNSDEIIFLKGANTINVYKKVDNEILKLKNLDEVRQNDKLQISYRAKDDYGVIFSIDGLNNITYHFPENIHSPKNLEIGKERVLASSYILDSAPYFEKFYFITSSKPFNFELVQDQILSIEIENGKIKKDLTLPNQYTVKSLTLIKE